MFFAHKKNERAIVMQQVRKEEKVKGKREKIYSCVVSAGGPQSRNSLTTLPLREQYYNWRD